MFPTPLFPQTLENTAMYTVFFNFSMCQFRWPTQTCIQKIVQTQCFLQCFYNGFRRKHRILHVFRHKVGPKHWCLQCFQCSGIQKHFKISLFTVFFLFLSVFPLPEAYQNDPKFHFNTLLSSDTQKISQTPPNSGLGAKSCLGPPPPQLKLI